MKEISDVKQNYKSRRSRLNPLALSTFYSTFSSNEGHSIESELDEAVACAEGVSWSMEEQGRLLIGSVTGLELVELEKARSYLANTKSWIVRAVL
jgi:hypothetical protein